MHTLVRVVYRQSDWQETEWARTVLLNITTRLALVLAYVNSFVNRIREVELISTYRIPQNSTQKKKKVRARTSYERSTYIFYLVSSQSQCLVSLGDYSTR